MGIPGVVKKQGKSYCCQAKGLENMVWRLGNKWELTVSWSLEGSAKCLGRPKQLEFQEQNSREEKARQTDISRNMRY